MTRRFSKSRARQQDKKVLGIGLTALAVGVCFLLAPALMGGSAPARNFAQALYIPGLMALAVGGVLIALHFLFSSKRSSAFPVVQEPGFEPGASNVVDFPAPRHLHAVPNEGVVTTSRRLTPKQWEPAVFDAIEWRRFEAVCESLFAQAGFEARTQSHGADGGVDIWLYSRHADGPAAIVQCKHWQSQPVGVKEMREFLGVMASHKLKRGTYATTSTYTADALRFAKDNGISALDRTSLLDLIARRTKEQQQELLAVAFEGDYWRPTCASCGVKMVERERKKDRSQFWGCSNYPRCHTTLNMRGSA